MRLPTIPVSLFSIVLGTVGLGNTWRAAARVWDVPAAIGEAVTWTGVAVWLVLAIFYVSKWLTRLAAARAELDDGTPFAALVGAATMFAGIGILPYAHELAAITFGLGALLAVAYGTWRTGVLWQGNRAPASISGATYLPLVAGSFVLSIGLSAFGLPDWGQLAFGAGFFSWLAIESVLLHRLYVTEPMAPALRPTLGIQLAPPAVGAVAYLGAFNTAGADIVVPAFLGYAVLQAVLLLRLLPWLSKSFTPGLWSFSFGATALATASITLAGRGSTGAIDVLALITFIAANIVVGGLAIGTVALLLKGKLLPQPAPAAPAGP